MTEVQQDYIPEEALRRALPAHVRGNLTEEMVENLNNIVADDAYKEIFRENLLGYTTVIKEGKFKLQDYVNAVRYITYKAMGSKDIDAYAKTFPDRYQRLVEEGTSNKAISAYASAYKKTKLVQTMFEQSMIPVHIANADIFQAAVNEQAHLMVHAKSEKVRSDAADSLIRHLKPPETKKMEVDITQKQDDSIGALREVTEQLVKQQQAMLENNTLTADQVAKSKLHANVIEEDAEFEEA